MRPLVTPYRWSSGLADYLLDGKSLYQCGFHCGLQVTIYGCFAGGMLRDDEVVFGMDVDALSENA